MKNYFSDLRTEFLYIRFALNFWSQGSGLLFLFCFGGFCVSSVSGLGFRNHEEEARYSLPSCKFFVSNWLFSGNEVHFLGNYLIYCFWIEDPTVFGLKFVFYDEFKLSISFLANWSLALSKWPSSQFHPNFWCACYTSIVICVCQDPLWNVSCKLGNSRL